MYHNMHEWKQISIAQIDIMIPHRPHIIGIKFLLSLGGLYKLKVGQRSFYNHSTGSLIYSELLNICEYMKLHKIYDSSKSFWKTT